MRPNRLALWCVLAGLSGGVALTGCVRVAPAPVPPPTRVDPAPVPVPPEPPAPTPPAPATPTGFVIVEDTSAAGQARGVFLGSKKIQAFLKNSGLQHAIVSTAAVGPDGQPVGGKVGEFIAKAKAKSLPYLFVLGPGSVVLKDEPCDLDPDRFVGVFELAPHKRALGNIPPPGGLLKGTWPTFGTTPTTKLIPRDQWVEVDFEAYLSAVKDQDGVGACNAFATVAAVEGAREMAGLTYQKLSPGYLYGNICRKDRAGRPVDSGSLLEDGLAWMTEHGTCTAQTVRELDWRRTAWPAAAAKEAASYRVVEAYVCPTFDHVVSALQQGFLIVEGVEWWDGYYVGKDGWLVPRKSGGNGGHALCGYGVAQRTVNGKTAWGIKTRNSWNVTWGEGGNAVFPEGMFRGDIGGWWAVRSVTRTPEPFPAAEPARYRRPPVSPADVLQLAP